MTRSLFDRARAAREPDPLCGVIVVARLDVAAQNHAAAEGAADPYPTPQRMRRDSSRRRRSSDDPRPTRARVLPSTPGGARITAPQTAGRTDDQVPYYAPLSVILGYGIRQENGGRS